MDTLTTTLDAMPDEVWAAEGRHPTDIPVRPRRQPRYSVETLVDRLDIRAAVYDPVAAPTGVKGSQANA